MTKICTTCKIEKQLWLYYSSSKGKFGKQTKCKSCVNKDKKTYNASKQGRFKNAKAKAGRRKLPWNLSFDRYTKLISLPCHYCDNKLDSNAFGVGLDRVDNDYGYLVGNVLPCCPTCNTLRNDLLTVDETIKVVDLICKLRNL